MAVNKGINKGKEEEGGGAEESALCLKGLNVDDREGRLLLIGHRVPSGAQCL
jgi:hypothetical protein